MGKCPARFRSTGHGKPLTDTKVRNLVEGGSIARSLGPGAAGGPG